MSENKMLIDAAHPEETRVVVLRAGRVEEFDYESAARKQLRGNIYLAKVTRVEPALQAAFIDYGGNRHGFLAFNEVHPDYYQIPMADRLALLEEEAAAEAEEEEEIDLAVAEHETAEDVDEEDDEDEDDDEDDGDEVDDGPYDVHAGSDDDDDDLEDDDDVTAQSDAGSQRVAAHKDTVPQATNLDETSSEAAEVASFEPNAVEGDNAPENQPTAADARSTVLSEAMPRDARLTETAPAAVSENASTDTADDHPPAHAETEPTAQRPDENAQSAALEPSGQPDYYSPLETDAEQPADSADEGETDSESESGDGRPRGRRGRPASGRRRRGGRSRRGRPGSAEPSGEDSDGVDQVGNEDALEELPSRPRRSRRSYKIQEVVKRRQVLLIQVVKEERGNKGAALTTYLSLAGRYTVLMPNTARGGGISRKITNPQDRKRLKAIANELDVPEGMGLIIRTAGAARTKQEIRRDFEYLLRLWESVRELTLQSTAPALVYEEGDLIKRSIRDLYNKDVEQVVVAGDEAYQGAKNFMRMLMPSHAKNVIKYDDPEPLFTRHGIERQLNAMFSPYVHLPSGGYLVINQTEALVAIDVNSGRSTREFSIEETALNTNLEASDEIARQLKLRDLAGLIVIDYIDMEERRNNRNVERRIREALKDDRARIQIGRISPFGLLEMSRQRLRTGVLEGSTTQCAHCQGTGIIRSVESVALGVLRGLEDAVMAGARTSLIASTTAEVALYILNNKRDFVIAMETRLGMPVVIQSSPKMAGANFTIEKGEAVAPVARAVAAKPDAVSVDWGFDGDDDVETEEDTETATAAADQPRRNEEGEGEDRSRRRRRRRRGGRRSDDNGPREASEAAEHADAAGPSEPDEDDEGDEGDEHAAEGRSDDEAGDDKSGRRRRRGRRGGRRNRGRNRDAEADSSDGDGDGDNDIEADADSDDDGVDDREHDSAVSAHEGRSSHRDDDEPRAANDDEPDTIGGTLTPAAGTPLATPIEGGTSEPEPRRSDQKDLPAAILDESPADETSAAFSIATEPVVETSNDTDAADTQPEPPRRPRGEPVASEPRVARITVSPDRPDSADGTTAGDGTLEQAPEKPTRRGWWQRKLLGDA
ncbi:MAG: Rne/Rng family ribonuclease [Alphaproteobacteria bacterium]|nr:Rne/Rng family ribonuclease [Alphaproteobacteria bacterium]